MATAKWLKKYPAKSWAEARSRRILADAESARKILRERGDKMTPEEKAYYYHILEEAEEYEKGLKERFKEAAKEQV